jgi:apolipoprotein N-acyltransferase
LHKFNTMKNLFKLNLVFVGFPIALCLMGFIDQNLLFWGLISTMLTGLFQVVVGIGMLRDEPNDKYLQVYVAAVVLFFITWFINFLIGYINAITFCLIPIPAILALYLTFIIYKKRNQ